MDLQGSISMIVPGLSAVNVDNTATALKTLRKGIQSRQVGATDMHEHSSRSHLVVKIVVSTEIFAQVKFYIRV